MIKNNINNIPTRFVIKRIITLMMFGTVLLLSSSLFYSMVSNNNAQLVIGALALSSSSVTNSKNFTNNNIDYKRSVNTTGNVLNNSLSNSDINNYNNST